MYEQFAAQVGVKAGAAMRKAFSKDFGKRNSKIKKIINNKSGALSPTQIKAIRKLNPRNK